MGCGASIPVVDQQEDNSVVEPQQKNVTEDPSPHQSNDVSLDDNVPPDDSNVKPDDDASHNAEEKPDNNVGEQPDITSNEPNIASDGPNVTSDEPNIVPSQPDSKSHEDEPDVIDSQQPQQKVEQLDESLELSEDETGTKDNPSLDNDAAPDDSSKSPPVPKLNLSESKPVDLPTPDVPSPPSDGIPSPHFKPSFVSKTLGSYEVQEIREHEERNNMRLAEKYSHGREEREEEDMKLAEYQAIIQRQAELERQKREEEERIIRKDLEDANDPSLLSFYVVVPSSFLPNEDSLVDDVDGVEDQRVLYRYHLPRDSATLLDLKLAVNMDFGFSFAQQRFFYNGSELDDNVLLGSLPSFDDGSYLALHPQGQPSVDDVVCLRPKQVETSINDVITTQLHDRNQLEDTDVRNWIEELVEIRSLPTDNLSESIEKEKRLLTLFAEFEYAAQTAVALILSAEGDPQSPIKPIKLSAIYGDHGGDTFVIGGIVIRKAQNWEVLQQDIGEGDLAFKVAGNEARHSRLLHSILNHTSSQALSSLYPTLVVTVDAFGHRYLCESALPVTPSMIVYGSFDSGVTIHRHLCVEKVAGDLAGVLNLKEHNVYSKLDPTRPIPFELSLNSEIYMTLDGNRFYIRNVGQLFPPDDPKPNTIDHVVDLFHPSFVMNYSASDELIEGYRRFTCREPRMCDHCGEVVMEFQYFSHPSREYDLCLCCYNNEPETKLRFLKTKLVSKIVPKEERLEYWRNSETGDVVFDEPIKKTPLNTNGYTLDLQGHPEGLIDRHDVMELKNASKKLSEVIVSQFACDLNEDKIQVHVSEELLVQMANRGITSKYLGVLLESVTSRHHKEMVVVEIVAGCLKTLIRDGLSYMENRTQEDLQLTVVYYLNQALTLSENENSLHLWSFIEGLALKKYNVELDDRVNKKIQLNSLLFSVCRKLGIVLDLSIVDRIDYEEEEPVKFDDVMAVVPVTSGHPISSPEVDRILAEARALDDQGKADHWWQPCSEERHRASELFSEAVDVAKCLYLDDNSSEPINSSCAATLATITLEVANHFESRHQENGRPEHSRWNRSAGIADDEHSTKARELYNETVKYSDIAMGLVSGAEYASVYAVDRPLHVVKSNAIVGLVRLNKTNLSNESWGDLDMNLMFVERVCGRLLPYTAKLHLDLAYCIHEANVQSEPELTEVCARNARRAYLSLVKVYGDDGSCSLGDTRYFSSLDNVGNEYVELAYRAVRQFETILASELAEIPRDLLAEKIEDLEVNGEIFSDDEF
ncbi:hypothetical protein P9112_002315 [Eukaryota sp. TZLM1-RC]